jgi:hypothetical protein
MLMPDTRSDVAPRPSSPMALIHLTLACFATPQVRPATMLARWVPSKRRTVSVFEHLSTMRKRVLNAVWCVGHCAAKAAQCIKGPYNLGTKVRVLTSVSVYPWTTGSNTGNEGCPADTVLHKLCMLGVAACVDDVGICTATSRVIEFVGEI